MTEGDGTSFWAFLWDCKDVLSLIMVMLIAAFIIGHILGSAGWP